MADLKQSFVWVAVPNGASGNVLRLSVIVYPRLFVLANGQPAAGTVPLVQFRDLLEWPGRSEGAQFDVVFGGGTPVRAKKVSRKPEMTSWQLLFTRDTPVECYDQPRTVTESTLAYPASAMYRFLKEQYQRVGQEYPWAPPLAETLAQGFGSVAQAIFAAGQESPKLREVWETFRGGAEPMNYVDDRNYGTDAARDWLLTKLFFRPGKVTPHGTDATAALTYPDPVDGGETTSTAPEFHKMIAMLTFHAEMARTFGLIMDLEVDRPAGMPAASTVKLIPKWSPAGKFPTTNACPATHYSAAFLPAPRPHDPEDVIDGTIAVNRPRYHVIQTELDSALVSLEKLVERLPRKVGESVVLPPLGTGGLILVRESAAQRHVEQRKAYNRNYDLRVGDPAQLEIFAEDLLMGYRLDIWSDRANRWHSLHQRHASYKFITGNKPTLFEYENEGWVNPAFSEVDAGLVTENLMSPFLVRWTGRSLSAPMEPDPAVVVDENMKFGVRYTVAPGTLPWLRYGITYRMKMRTLDLAGNGQPFVPGVAPDVTGATAPITYRRFESVGAPPVVVVQDALTTGESVPRLVVRDTAPELPADRFIAPPQTTVEVCEAHGLFDTPNGVDPAKVAEAEERYETDVPGEYSGAELPVDYLADFFARGAALLNVPGAAGPVQIPFGDAWPGRRSFRLRLQAGTGAPHWDTVGRILTIYLPPAETARVRLSSHFAGGDLDTMALWHWLQENLTGDRLLQMRQGILDGRHWALTPGRELVLVHAVKQPLASPDFKTIGALRGLGETSATFSGVIGIDGKSTGKVAVRVQWVEPVDELEADEPDFVGGRGHAFQAKVGSARATTVNVESKFDFRDTKYRRVQLTATGTTRFTDFFPKDTTLTREGNPIEVDVLNTARPTAPRVQYVVPTFGWEQPPQQADGSVTRIRWGGGLRVYLDRPWYSTGDGEMLAVILYDEQTKSFFRRPETPDGVAPWVTLWGADPLWKSGDIYPYPKLEHFKSALSTQAGLKLAEAGDAKILVAGHAVKYDPDSKRWYCDIELDAGPAYFPFIRLALARFQPRSVSGAHLSPVVTTEIVQIAPNRTATATRSGSKANVAVAGQTYTTGRAGPAVVRVAVETAASQGGMLAWSPEGAPVTLKREGLAWTGSVDLPAVPSGTPQYRLVIREYERLLSDAGVTERLVYADAIEI
jgi:hypothetical protein